MAEKKDSVKIGFKVEPKKVAAPKVAAPKVHAKKEVSKSKEEKAMDFQGHAKFSKFKVKGNK
jgi:hypothetical protein